ncbi:unnamed protein product, partial [Rotaria magnacalcarata]
NARQIHEHNETSLMGNVNTNSIPLTSSSRKQTYHQIPNIKMNSTTNKSSIPIDKWKTSYQLIPNYLKMSSRLFVDLLYYWETITDSVPIEIIWLSNIPKDTTRINSINWAYPRTIENLNKRQTIIQNKLKEIQHQLMIHVNQESFIARSSISKSIDLINLIDTAIREFVHQGQQRLRTMYGEQKLILEFDHNDLRLVKSLYSLNPTNEQLLHVQKLWRSKVKACKRAIQQCHDNSSLHDQPNTEINTDFVDYFEDTFIGRVIRNNRRRAPRFSVNMWNCFSRLDEELLRTNNSSEGWNRAFKNSARENPSIYESIADLRIEQHSNLILAEQLEAGAVKTRKRIKYEMLNEQLQQLASNFYLLPRDIFQKSKSSFQFLTKMYISSNKISFIYVYLFYD